MLNQHHYPLAVLGLGSYSTLFYVRKLNELYHQKHGEYSTCPFLMLNADFNEVNHFLPQQFTKLKPITTKYLHNIENLGGRNIIVPNITLHETIDLLRLPQQVNIIHPVHETAKTLLKQGYKQAIIFGTSYTMSAKYIPNIFKEYGINCFSPNKGDVMQIDQIRKEIYTEGSSKSILKQLQSLVEKYTPQGQVVLSCTELSVASEQMAALSVTDMAVCQMKAGITVLT